MKTATTEAITVATILFFFMVFHPFLDFHDYITPIHKMQYLFDIFFEIISKLLPPFFLTFFF